MMRAGWLAWMLAWMLACRLAAHVPRGGPSHDLLQSLFVRIEPTHLVLEWSGTPSPSGSAFLARALDRDGDGRVAEAEERAFARRVAAGVRVRLDGRRVHAGDVTAMIPALGILREGDVPVRLAWKIPIASLSSGAHHVEVDNRFKAPRSAYLSNAVLPQDRRLRITAQRRNRSQRSLRVEFIQLSAGDE